MAFAQRLKRFWRSPWLEKCESFAEVYWLLKTHFYYRCFFGHIGHKSKLLQPMRMRNVQYIHIGDDVIINRHSFLGTWPIEGAPPPRLVFEDGAVIGHLNHITCVGEVIIGNKVLTADKVHISDNSHGFSDPTVPILEQAVVSKDGVRIGDGTWIGE